MLYKQDFLGIFMKVGRNELSVMAQRMLSFLNENKVANIRDLCNIKVISFFPNLDGGRWRDVIRLYHGQILPGLCNLEYRYIPNDFLFSKAILKVSAGPGYNFLSISVMTSERLAGYKPIESDMEGNLLQINTPNSFLLKSELEKLAEI